MKGGGQCEMGMVSKLPRRTERETAKKSRGESVGVARRGCRCGMRLQPSKGRFLLSIKSLPKVRNLKLPYRGSALPLGKCGGGMSGYQPNMLSSQLKVLKTFRNSSP